jgi:hypothetical protein
MPGMTAPARGRRLVGRDDLVARAYDAVTRAMAGVRCAVLVSGEAGIGKTSLLDAVAQRAAAEGALVGWGTCAEQGPGYWPWTQAVQTIIAGVGDARALELAGRDAPLLASLTPSLSEEPAPAVPQDRLLLMDAVGRWLAAIAEERTVLLVLDDLQWADDSSLSLLDLLARAPQPGALCVLGGFRDHELSREVQQRFGALLSCAEHLNVSGLDRDAVAELLRDLAGEVVADDTVDLVFGRAAGHPLFTRELGLAAVRGDAGGSVPVAVREAITRRVTRLPELTQRVLSAAAVSGSASPPDVLAGAVGCTTSDIVDAAAAASDAGLLAGAGTGPLRFAHDLYREAVEAAIDHRRALELHQAIAVALEDRAARGGEVQAAEVARHFLACLAIDGPERAARWALRAAAADHRTLAFSEAAAQLRRWRAAVSDAGLAVADEQLVEVLLAEADALWRSGSPIGAKGLLRSATEAARRCSDPRLLARTALASAQLGAQFATRRDALIAELDEALEVVTRVDLPLQARLGAALARELAHSVADDRPRAAPISEQALALARNSDSPEVLAGCLLARHDVLWTPGQAANREAITRELLEVTQRRGDDEASAEAMLLLANALLEQGSAAYTAALDGCLDLLDRLGQPRHTYTASTRRAAVALLRGDLVDAERRIMAAAALGESIREPDAGNVLMSQRLELVRARGDADQLKAFADEAVGHWLGAPVHAHAIAAGFSARAGDNASAAAHLAAVHDLGGWRTDRSYLWSVLVRELAVAAVALNDSTLCEQLLDDVLPLADSCGVNGAVVAFAGSHAHTAGLLATALGRPDAPALVEQARRTYERLGARGWLAELVPQPIASAHSFTRQGAVWQLDFLDEHAVIQHSKGLADIAVLLTRPDVDVHVLELMGSAQQEAPAGQLTDRTALSAYRQRLADLAELMADARDDQNHELATRRELEREALLAELRRSTTPGGAGRTFANHSAERARKAVSGRIREAVRKLRDDMPALAAHLDQTVLTGTFCRYRAEPGIRWEVQT